MPSIRVEIQWDDSLASMNVLKGTITATKTKTDYNFKYSGEHQFKSFKYEEILRCAVIVSHGIISFKSIEDNGFSGEIFELLKPTIDNLVHSYNDGYNLKKEIFAWVSSCYFAIAFVEPSINLIPSTRTIGIYNNLMFATNYVKSIDPNKTVITKYIVIEELSFGSLPEVETEIWFEWNKNLSKYLGIERPSGVGHLKNFTIG